MWPALFPPLSLSCLVDLVRDISYNCIHLIKYWETESDFSDSVCGHKLGNRLYCYHTIQDLYCVKSENNNDISFPLNVFFYFHFYTLTIELIWAEFNVYIWWLMCFVTQKTLNSIIHFMMLFSISMNI